MAALSSPQSANTADICLPRMLQEVRAAQQILAVSTGSERNRALEIIADVLLDHQGAILEANQVDLIRARAAELAPPLLNRLALTEASFHGLLQGLRDLARLPDPLGRGRGLWTLANGLKAEQVSVPLGVIAMIYESRPGVTIEASGLAIKSGNGLILRGGREALTSNLAIMAGIQEGLARAGFPRGVVQTIEDPDRRHVGTLMHLEGLDLLIPRGGAELIRRVTQEATVPVIQTGVGNCHVYVDRGANLSMAAAIVRDAKVSNPAVCNAAETVLVHRAVAGEFLPLLARALNPYGVRLHADAAALPWLPGALPATPEDFAQEYLDYDLAVGVVDDLDQALKHIAQYGTGHSEAIVTEDAHAGQCFQERVDAAVVYWNASTRFTDGGQFGFGAEVGISTQKLHARGPMGLDALTTVKTLMVGKGQTRDIPADTPF